MEPLTVGAIGLVVMLVLLIVGMPVGYAFAILGFLGVWCISGWRAALGVLQTVPFSTVASYTLTVVPMFVLMGQLAFHGGISEQLYSAARKFVGHLRGGLALATIVACAGFAAICGSSPATAATMATAAVGEMRKHGYSDALATGCVAAGGTLGILIPPSIGFVLYGTLTEQSIGKLLISGIIPGIVLALFYSTATFLWVRWRPEIAPAYPRVPLAEALKGLRDVWPALAVFVVTIGGMYAGIFTVTEAAAIGALATLVVGVCKRRLGGDGIVRSLLDTASTSVMVFTIVIGAMMFGYFLTVTGLPEYIAELVTGLHVSRYVILAIILVVYLILGALMDELAMILLTIPIVYPIILQLGFDPIWFGVMVVVIMEQGMIAPPVGINVYVVAGVVKDVPMGVIYRGIMPYLVAIIVFQIVLILFPQLALWLPSMMGR